MNKNVNAPWLIGESNPYQRHGADPEHRFDLYPEPSHASGGRLCRLVLGMSTREYLHTFVRRDLLEGKWSVPKARAAAAVLWRETGTSPLVLLGAKVAAAFGFAFMPMTCIEHGCSAGTRKVAILPHPSGLSQAWHAPGSYEQARAIVLALIPAQMRESTPGEST